MLEGQSTPFVLSLTKHFGGVLLPRYFRHEKKRSWGNHAIGRYERYNRRVLFEKRDPSGWVLKALRECANTVVSELSRLDDDTLGRAPAEGEWCLKEIAAHVRDAEDLALRQMTAIVEGRRGALPAWDIDLLPAERDYRSSDVFDLLTEFRRLRSETTELLWGLSGPDWRSSGEHPYRGEVTVETLARELAQHDLEHLAEIRRLKHDLGAAPAGALENDWR